MVRDAAKIRRIVEESTPGLDHVISRDRAWAKVISAKGSFFVSPSGLDIRQEARMREVIRLAKESEYKEGGRDEIVGSLDGLERPKTALIFAEQAKRLGVEVGDYVTITAPTGSGRTNTIDVTVVAVAADLGFMSNWNLFVPSADVHELYQTADDTTSVVMIYLKDPSRSEEVMGHLREVFEAEGYALMDHQAQPFFMKFESVAGEDWTGQKLDLTIWSDEISFMNWILTAIDGISFFLLSILTVIIAIGVMNSMWISVRERTGEVGTVRAIGMTRRQVLLMFLTEALLLGLAAALLGSLAGVALALGVDAVGVEVPSDAVKAILMSDVLHLSVSPLHVAGGVLGLTAVTGLSALWPAFRASRLEPVTAIHHAG